MIKTKNSKKYILITLIMVLCAGLCFAKINPDTKIKNSDWKDKALGESEKPAWIMQLIWGNDSVFRKEYNIPKDKVVKIGQARASSFESAKLQSQLNVFAAVANELKNSLMENLSNEGIDEENLAIVERIASQTTVTLTGMKEETFFWWKTLEKNPKTKKYVTRYVYVTVYTIPEKNWNKAVEMYLSEILKNVQSEIDTEVDSESFKVLD